MRFPDPESSRLILLGASGYDHGMLNDLPAVHNCIQDLRDLLTAPITGGFLPANCLIPDDNAGLPTLVEKISDFSLTASDVLVTWFIGHGMFDIETHRLHLALSKTNPEHLGLTALPFGELKKAFLTSRAKVKILIVDCCFSGRVITEMAMGVPDLANMVSEQVAVDGTYIMTACSGHDIALAPPDDRYTAFTGSVIKALQGAIPLTMRDIYREVSRSLRERDLPEPHQASSSTAAELALLRPAQQRYVPVGGVTITIDAPDDPESTVAGRLGARTNGPNLTITDDNPVRTNDQPEAIQGSAFEPLSEAEVEERMQSLCANAEAIAWSATEPYSNEAEARARQVIVKLRQVITEMAQLGKPSHPFALKVRDLYAFCLGRANRHRDAVDQCRRLVRARLELYGPEHDEVLASRHNLAHMIGLAGDTASAVSEFELLVEDRRRLLGDRHRDALLSRYGLAYWTALNGQAHEAVVMCEELCGDYDWWSGPNDEETLKSLALLAWAQGLVHDSAGARETYADLAGRWAELNGPECAEANKYTELSDYWAGKATDEP